MFQIFTKSVLLCALLGILFSMPSFAQETTETAVPSWTVQFDDETIYWHRVTSLGFLIAQTNKSVYGVNPENGEIAWKNDDLPYLDDETFDEIEGSPFVAINSKSGDFSIFVLDPIEGKVYFSSKDAGIAQVDEFYFLYENRSIFVIGRETNSATKIAMVSMENGSVLWTQNPKYDRITGLVGLGNDEFLLTSVFAAYKMNSKTGEIIWDTSFSGMKDGAVANALLQVLGDISGGAGTTPEAQVFFPATDIDAFFIAVDVENVTMNTSSSGTTSQTTKITSSYNAFRMSDGKKLWKKEVSMSKPIGLILPIETGLMVALQGGNIHLLDYMTGAKLWGKRKGGVSMKGEVTGYAYVGDDLMLVGCTDESSNAFKEKCHLNIVDKATGEFRYKKPTKIKGTVEYLEETAKGMLVGTNKEINILNVSTGVMLSDDPIPAAATLMASEGDQTFAFSVKGKSLYALDKSNGSMGQLGSTDLKFEGKEKPESVELSEQGIFMSSSQNVAMVGRDGKLLFHEYYPAPQEPRAKRAFLRALAVLSILDGISSGINSGAYGYVSQNIQVRDADQGAQLAKDLTGYVSDVYGDYANQSFSFSGQAFQAANRRFKASTQTRDFVFIMMAAGKKENHLAQVSKSDGKIITAINLGNEKYPKYNVDMIENRVFYQSNANTIDGYQF